MGGGALWPISCAYVGRRTQGLNVDTNAVPVNVQFTLGDVNVSLSWLSWRYGQLCPQSCVLWYHLAAWPHGSYHLYSQHS